MSVPQYTFGETHYLADAVVTDAYKAALFYATGRANSGVFRGLAIGECMFLGASGSKRGTDDWEVSFKFAASPNAVNLAIGPSITVAYKGGWDYLWVLYEDQEDATAKRIVKRPIAAYVERVIVCRTARAVPPFIPDKLSYGKVPIAQRPNLLRGRILTERSEPGTLLLPSSAR